MRKYIDLFNEAEQIDEVGMLRHDDEGDKAMWDTVQWSHDLQKKRADAGTWDTRWEKIGRLKTLDIYTAVPINRYNPKLFFTDENGELMGHANLLGGRHNDPEAVTMRFIYFKPEARGKGDAFMVYLWALSNDFTLESDTAQSEMSRALWRRLSKTPGVKVQAHAPDGTVLGDDPDLAYSEKHSYLSARRG